MRCIAPKKLAKIGWNVGKDGFARLISWLAKSFLYNPQILQHSPMDCLQANG